VHDLLDRIYFEGDVEARYAAAVPPAMRPQIAANLRAFMQLALTLDAGRYPTLAGFIRELASLTDDADAAPGEGLAADGENAVRLLTIHGAKGLEAPIVWLLGGSDHARGDSYGVLAPWPPDAARPTHFSLFGKQDERGAAREPWFMEEAELAQRESDNLLYVALTRAGQGLIVSGDAERCAWLQRVDAAWQDRGLPADLPAAAALASAPASAPRRIDAPPVGQRLSPPPVASPAAASRRAVPRLPRTPCAARRTRDLPALAARLGLEDRSMQSRPPPAPCSRSRSWRTCSTRRSIVAPTTSGAAGCRRPPAAARPRGGVRRCGVADRLQDRRRQPRPRRRTAGRAPSAQLAGYRSLLAGLYPGKPVHAALLLADGRLVDMTWINARASNSYRCRPQAAFPTTPESRLINKPNPASRTANRSWRCCASCLPTAAMCWKSAAAPASTRCISHPNCRISSGRPPTCPQHHAGIRAWLEDAGLPNVLPPLALDVSHAEWRSGRYDAVFSANTLHIMGWPEVERFLPASARCSKPGGVLAVYGPFNYNGAFTSESNARFDAWLKARDPASGVRDFEAVDALARAHGLVLQQDIAMPANNRTLVWRRKI
jgi:hypothetical protein